MHVLFSLQRNIAASLLHFTLKFWRVIGHPCITALFTQFNYDSPSLICPLVTTLFLLFNHPSSSSFFALRCGSLCTSTLLMYNWSYVSACLPVPFIPYIPLLSLCSSSLPGFPLLTQSPLLHFITLFIPLSSLFQLILTFPSPSTLNNPMLRYIIWISPSSLRPAQTLRGRKSFWIFSSASIYLNGLKKFTLKGEVWIFMPK